jgi:SAM-dependent methyltransferase
MNNDTVKKERWHLAQAQERRWWEEKMAALDFSYFARFAMELQEIVAEEAAVKEHTRILEIGCGPAGILTHLDARFRIGMDPLERFYGAIDKCRLYRDPGVRYLAAKGEGLPFGDGSFDLIIIDNILDHCEDIDAVVQEMKRALATNGIIYLRNFTVTEWGFFLAEVIEFFRIDRGHPYHFREKDLHMLFSRHGLKPVLIKRRGFMANTGMLLSSMKLSGILRALSCSIGDKALFVLRSA